MSSSEKPSSNIADEWLDATAELAQDSNHSDTESDRYHADDEQRLQESNEEHVSQRSQGDNPFVRFLEESLALKKKI